MSYTWTRQTRTYQLDGTSVNNTPESPLAPSDRFAYVTDHRFVAAKSFPMTVPAGDPQSSITFRTETTRINSSGNKVSSTSFSETRFTWFKDAQGNVIREVREQRDGTCDFDTQANECLETWAEDWDVEYDYPINVAPDNHQVTAGLNHLFFVISKDPQDPFQTQASSGSYRSELIYLENGTPVGGTEHIGDYDVREMRIRELRNKCAVDPEEEQPKAYAEIYVYPTPGASPLVTSWEPTNPLDRDIEIRDASNAVVYTNTDTEMIDHSPPQASGLIATIETPFEGKDNNGKFLKEDVDIYLAILGDCPGPGNTRATSGGAGALFHRKCPCEDHQNEAVIAVVLILGGAGPLATLFLLYRSLDKCKGPGSMGYGWSTMGSARITEPETGVVVYRSENGMIMRWEDDGNGNYLPSREDNYTDLTVDAGSTDARYVLKFRGQSIREFAANGRLKTERDRNDNTLTYNYTGTQLDSVQDNRGHSVHFGYTGSPDGLQPTSIRANDPVTGRLTQLEYDSSTHRLEKVTDAGGQVTEFEYDSNDRLSKQTLVRPTLGDLVTEYYYTISGRLFAEVINGNLRRDHTRDGLTTTITTTPLINGEPGTLYRNQHFEKDTEGRVLLHALNYEELGQTF